MSAASVSAKDIDIEYDIDFDNSIINVHCTTEARYNQALSVVLYDGTDMGNDISKIVKIADTDADENGEADVALKLSSNTPSGDYVISVAGGGAANNSGSRRITFVNKSGLDQIINDINSAAQANVKETFEKYGDIFALPADDEVYNKFLSVRKEDYNNTFSSVNDIKNSLKMSEHFYNLSNTTQNAELISYVKDNAKDLGIDIEDEDFVKSERKYGAAFIKLIKATPITGTKVYEKIRSEALAIAKINSSNIEELTAAVLKYGDIIGISTSDYQAACKKYGEVEVNKALHDKNFDSCKAIATAYQNRINDLAKKQNENNPGGSGGSSKNTGSIVSSSVGAVYVNPPETVVYFTDFTDLSEASWAQASVKNLAKEGIVSGYEDKTFKPNKEVTREEFVTMLVRAFKLYDADAKCEFKDINADDWCYQYVASVAAKEYVSGFGDGSFGKGSVISRQDAAAILYRAASTNGLYFSENEVNFGDGEAIAEYAKDAIGALSNTGIISGFEDATFRPLESLTRAQAVKMIENILNL